MRSREERQRERDLERLALATVGPDTRDMPEPPGLNQPVRTYKEWD